MSSYRGLIHQYRDFLPIDDKSIITLHEGRTPLLRAKNLENAIGYEGEIHLKYEGMNPTGSFKDRGMTYAVSKAVEEGAKAIICASTGNTSASAAAYAAKAKVQCVVLIPQGNIALGKLSQAMMHGATVVEIKGNFDVALDLVREMGKTHPIHVVNSINPYRLQGQKTGAFEICETLGRSPDYHFIPVGNAGNITAYWMGYNEYFNLKKVSCKPIMMGYQASGAAPLVSGKVVKNPETIATAIRIGNPASWKQALAARDESGGIIDKVTDREIVQAYKLLGRVEGVYCEPASATSVAGLIKLNKEGGLPKGKTIVCTLTGHGLKDPDTAIKNSVKPLRSKPTLKDLEKVLKL